jgi:hypothetical protein
MKVYKKLEKQGYVVSSATLSETEKQIQKHIDMQSVPVHLHSCSYLSDFYTRFSSLEECINTLIVSSAMETENHIQKQSVLYIYVHVLIHLTSTPDLLIPTNI